MNLRPFNLLEAKAGKPIVSRLDHGKIVPFFSVETQYFVAQHGHSNELVKHGFDGSNCLSNRDYDLFMAPEIKTVRLDFIKSLKTGEIRAMKVDFRLANEWVIAAKNVEVTFTEGEGL